MSNKSKIGFTIIELLVVIAIIGLLASIVLVWLGDTRAKARDAKRFEESGTLRTALELHYDDYEEYPEAIDWIKIEEDADTNGSFSQAMEDYLPQIPSDPLYPKVEEEKVFAYQYKSTEDQQGYKIHIEMETGDYASYEVCGGAGGGDIEFEGTSWTCGDSVTFIYKGSSVTYGTVSSSGNCWLDRNLGATRVATAYNDSAAYGDLFQWGRLDDGHQTRTSGLTATLSTTDVPGHSNFIYSTDSPFDWRSPQNNNLWQKGVNGINNPCPEGWRLATWAEWNNERTSWSQQNYNGAFASPLKLTAAGHRLFFNAALEHVGSTGYYYTSAPDNTHAAHCNFDDHRAGMGTCVRAYAASVRCLKD